MLNLINDTYYIIYSVSLGFIPLGYFSNYDDAQSCVDKFSIVCSADYTINKIFVKR